MKTLNSIFMILGIAILKWIDPYVGVKESVLKLSLNWDGINK